MDGPIPSTTIIARRSAPGVPVPGGDPDVVRIAAAPCGNTGPIVPETVGAVRARVVREPPGKATGQPDLLALSWVPPPARLLQPWGPHDVGTGDWDPPYPEPGRAWACAQMVVDPTSGSVLVDKCQAPQVRGTFEDPASRTVYLAPPTNDAETGRPLPAHPWDGIFPPGQGFGAWCVRGDATDPELGVAAAFVSQARQGVDVTAWSSALARQPGRVVFSPTGECDGAQPPVWDAFAMEPEKRFCCSTDVNDTTRAGGWPPPGDAACPVGRPPLAAATHHHRPGHHNKNGGP